MINYLIVKNTYLRLMRDHVGERESHGPNRSPSIDAMCKRGGVALGSPYCLLGATCVLDDACKELGLKNPVKVHAGTQNWWGNVPMKYRRGSAKEGFIGIYQKRKDQSKGHAVVVVSDEDIDHEYKTIEFNTNGEGSRNGDGVYARARKVGGDANLSVRGFVDVVQWICEANGVQL
jgi:hypothetical protein